MLIRVLRAARDIARSTFALVGRLATAVSTVVAKIPAAMLDIARGVSTGIGSMVTSSVSLASSVISASMSTLGNAVTTGIMSLGQTVQNATDKVVDTLIDPAKRVALVQGIKDLRKISGKWTQNVQDFFTVLNNRRVNIKRRTKPIDPGKGASQAERDEYERLDRLYKLEERRAARITKAAEGVRVAFGAAQATVKSLYQTYKKFYDTAIASQLELERAVRTSATTIAANADLLVGDRIVDDAVEKVSTLAPKLKEIQEDLIRSAPEIVGVTSDELLKTFNQVTIQMGQLVGQTEGLQELGIADELEAAAYLSKNLAGAMKVVGLNARDVQQEVRAILTGDIDINARLARQLNITRAQLELEKQKGTLVKFLADKTATIAAANQLYNNSLENTLSVLEEIGQTTLRTLGKAGYAGFERGLLAVREALKDIQPEITEFSNLVGEAFGTTFELIAASVVEAIEKIGEHLPAIGEKIAEIIGYIGILISGLIRLTTIITEAFIENQTLIQKSITLFGQLFLAIKIGIPSVMLLAKVLGAIFAVPILGTIAAWAAAIVAIGAVITGIAISIVKLTQAFTNLLHLGLTKFFEKLGSMKMPGWLEEMRKTFEKIGQEGKETRIEMEKMQKVAKGELVTAKNLQNLALFSENMGKVNKGMQNFHRLMNIGQMNDLTTAMMKTVEAFSNEADSFINQSSKMRDLLKERQELVNLVNQDKELSKEQEERLAFLTGRTNIFLETSKQLTAEIKKEMIEQNKYGVLTTETAIQRIEQDQKLGELHVAMSRVMIDQLNYKEKSIQENEKIRKGLHEQVDAAEAQLNALSDLELSDEQRIKAAENLDVVYSNILAKHEAMDAEGLAPKRLVTYADDATIAAEALSGAIARLGRATEASLIKDLEASIKTYTRSLSMANQPLEQQDKLLREINTKLTNTRDLEERLKLRKQLVDGVAAQQKAATAYLDTEQKILAHLESRGRITSEQRAAGEAQIETAKAQLEYVTGLNSALDDSVENNQEIQAQKNKIADVLEEMGVSQEKLNALESASLDAEKEEKTIAKLEAQLVALDKLEATNKRLTPQQQKLKTDMQEELAAAQARHSVAVQTSQLNRDDLISTRKDLEYQKQLLEAGEKGLEKLRKKHRVDLDLTNQVTQAINEQEQAASAYRMETDEAQKKELKRAYEIAEQKKQAAIEALEQQINEKLLLETLTTEERQLLVNAKLNLQMTQSREAQLSVTQKITEGIKQLNKYEELHNLLLQRQVQSKTAQVGLGDDLLHQAEQEQKIFLEEMKNLEAQYQFGKDRYDLLLKQAEVHTQIKDTILESNNADSLTEQLGLEKAVEVIDKLDQKLKEIADRPVAATEVEDSTGILGNIIAHKQKIKDLTTKIQRQDELGLITDEERARFAEEIAQLEREQADVLATQIEYQYDSKDITEDRMNVAMEMADAQREMNNLELSNAAIQKDATVETKMRAKNLQHVSEHLQTINRVHASTLSTEEERANVLRDITLEMQKQSVQGDDPFSRYSLKNLEEYEAKLKQVHTVMTNNNEIDEARNAILAQGAKELEGQQNRIDALRELNNEVNISEEEREQRLAEINGLTGDQVDIFLNMNKSATDVNTTIETSKRLISEIVQSKEDQKTIDSLIVEAGGEQVANLDDIIALLKEDVNLRELSVKAEERLKSFAQSQLDFLRSRKKLTEEIKDTELRIRGILLDAKNAQSELEIFKIDFQIENYEKILELRDLFEKGTKKFGRKTKKDLKPIVDIFKQTQKTLKKMGIELEGFGKDSVKNAIQVAKLTKQRQEKELEVFEDKQKFELQEQQHAQKRAEMELQLFKAQQESGIDRLRREQAIVQSALQYLHVLEKAGVVAKGTYAATVGELGEYNQMMTDMISASGEGVSLAERQLQAVVDQNKAEGDLLKAKQKSALEALKLEQAMELAEKAGISIKEAMKIVKEETGKAADNLERGADAAERQAGAAERAAAARANPNSRLQSESPYRRKRGEGNAEAAGNYQRMDGREPSQYYTMEQSRKAAGSFVFSFIDHLSEPMQAHYRDAVGRLGTQAINRTLQDARRAALAQEFNMYKRGKGKFEGQWISQAVSYRGSRMMGDVLKTGNEALKNAATAIANSQKAFLKKQIDTQIEQEKTNDLLVTANELAAQGNKSSAIRAFDQYKSEMKNQLSDLEYYEFSKRNQNTRKNLIKQANAVAKAQRDQLKEEMRQRRAEAREQSMELMRELAAEREEIISALDPTYGEAPWEQFERVITQTLQDKFGDTDENVQEEQANAALVERFGQEVADKIAGIIPITKSLIDQLENGLVDPDDLMTDNKVFLDPESGSIILSGADPDFETARQLIEITAIRQIEEDNKDLLTSSDGHLSAMDATLKTINDAMFGDNGFQGIKLAKGGLYGPNGDLIKTIGTEGTTFKDLETEIKNAAGGIQSTSSILSQAFGEGGDIASFLQQATVGYADLDSRAGFDDLATGARDSLGIDNFDPYTSFMANEAVKTEDKKIQQEEDNQVVNALYNIFGKGVGNEAAANQRDDDVQSFTSKFAGSGGIYTTPDDFEGGYMSVPNKLNFTDTGSQYYYQKFFSGTGSSPYSAGLSSSGINDLAQALAKNNSFGGNYFDAKSAVSSGYVYNINNRNYLYYPSNNGGGTYQKMSLTGYLE